MKAAVKTVQTPQGEGRLHTRRARHPLATLMLSHGAGGGVDARDLVTLAHALPSQGITTVLFEQPWRVAGRKIAGAPATLDAALRAACDVMRVRTPLVLGGRSAGARSAARTARSLGASGCLLLSFPLHPPGRPEASRLDELTGVRLPTLVVQGERDPFGRPEEFPAGVRGVDLAVVPGADHGLKVPARGPVTQEEAMGIVVETVLEWLVRDVVGSEGGNHDGA
ncbi:hydrolase [Nocardioides gansuensis]|uniref:Hydrolase n=1 Tax=Nocardioides gansuensis TaxID=2138300 RepID=A0A2T8FC68_9ACTN|nr:alpha/beta family hydrolase [Nocardioides gansuensis]PVG83295.1 hydrolase [Nocardioides gansuensis]